MNLTLQNKVDNCEPITGIRSFYSKIDIRHQLQRFGLFFYILVQLKRSMAKHTLIMSKFNLRTLEHTKIRLKFRKIDALKCILLLILYKKLQILMLLSSPYSSKLYWDQFV